MFKLISPDLPAIAATPNQTSTPLIRIWKGTSRSQAPIAKANYLLPFQSGVGLSPIAYNPVAPLYTGLHYQYTIPAPFYEVFINGLSKADNNDPRKSVPNVYWLKDLTLNIYNNSKITQINVDLVLRAVAIATTTANQYQIDTSTWGIFTVPTNIFVDGIELTESDSLSAGTFKVFSGRINIYTSAPLPNGDAIVHINQNAPLVAKAAIATYGYTEFAHVCNLAGRVYLRALDYLSPEVYEFTSDDAQYVTLFVPLDLFNGLAIAPATVANSNIRDITQVSF